MTDFSTLFCKSYDPMRVMRQLVRVALLLTFAALTGLAQAQSSADIAQFRVERTGDDIVVSAQLQFELASAVEDALVKGVPIVFTFSADLLRERWYWFDRKVTGVERSARVVYQPLTRRWRVGIGSGAAAGGAGLALNQTYDTLSEALAGIKRVVGWKVADATDLEPGVKYRVDFRFRLDMTQLPRPLQIGVLGQSEWDIAASASQVWLGESSK